MSKEKSFMDSIIESGLNGKPLGVFLRDKERDVVKLSTEDLNKLINLGLDKTDLLHIAFRLNTYHEFKAQGKTDNVKQQEAVVKFSLEKGASLLEAGPHVSQLVVHKDVILANPYVHHQVAKLLSASYASDQDKAAVQGEFIKVAIDYGIDLNKQIDALTLSHTSLHENQELLLGKGGLTGGNFLKAILQSSTRVDSSKPEEIKIFVDLLDKAAENKADLKDAVLKINYTKPIADALLADKAFHEALTHDIEKFLYVIKQDTLGEDKKVIIDAIEKAFVESHLNITEDLNSDHSLVASNFDADIFGSLVSNHTAEHNSTTSHHEL